MAVKRISGGRDDLFKEVMTLRDLVMKMSDDLSKIIFEFEYQAEKRMREKDQREKAGSCFCTHVAGLIWF